MICFGSLKFANFFSQCWITLFFEIPESDLRTIIAHPTDPHLLSSTPITDDHVPLNAAGIPALDIIDSRYISKGKWHTSRDDLNSIAKKNLEIVGAVVLELMKKKIKK